jgi:hypothetical protein
LQNRVVVMFCYTTAGRSRLFGKGVVVMFRGATTGGPRCFQNGTVVIFRNATMGGIRLFPNDGVDTTMEGTRCVIDDVEGSSVHDKGFR